MTAVLALTHQPVDYVVVFVVAAVMAAWIWLDQR